jgi:phage tail sheath gpL-like
MSISFNQIPANLRVNKIAIELDNSLANSGAVLMPVKCLLVGQQLTTGTYTEGTIVKVPNADAVAKAAGYGSHLHLMAKQFFLNNKANDCFVLPLDDVGVAKAVGKITVTSTSAGSGSVFLYIGGQLVNVPVSLGDDEDAIAANMVIAINAVKNLPVTALIDGTDANEVNITAKNAGTLGNKIDVRVNYYDDEKLPSDVAITITAMATGAVDPSLTGLLPTAEIWYNYMAFPYTDSTSLGLLKTWLDARSEATVMLDCIAFCAKNDTQANLEILGNAHNNEWLVISENYLSASTDFEKSAAIMGGFSYRQNLGVGTRVVPFQGREIKGILPAKESDKFVETQRNSLLFNGISTSKVRQNTEFTDQLITTYKANDAGAVDWSYLYVETLEGLRFIRWDMANYLASKYPNRIIGDENVKYAPGNTLVITLSSLKNDLIGRAYSYWARENIIVSPEDFKNALIAEVNILNSSRVDMLLVPTIAKGLRQIAGKISFK